LPKAEAAYAECTGSGAKKIHHIVQKIKYTMKNANPEGLLTCIADLEALIPDVEHIIAEFKAGNHKQALADAIALEPEFEKA
jgi:hypothetical protein